MASSTQSTGVGLGTDLSTSQPPSSIPVEMSELETSKGEVARSHDNNIDDVSAPSTAPPTSNLPPPTSTSGMATDTSRPAESTTPAISALNPSKDPLSSSSSEPAATDLASSVPGPSSSSAPTITRFDSVAIGPSIDAMPAPVVSEVGSVLVITLLLTSGARHPYKIDEKYLTKRNVKVPGVTESGKKDPFSISVYTLKELILREWRDEWEVQPSSPSSIRLIYFGRLLDDKTALKECKFNAEAANVVHMTVRPQDIVDEEDATKSKALTRDREGGESTAGCRCVIL